MTRPTGRSLHCVFFFNDTATTEIYTLSLHDALPISESAAARRRHGERRADPRARRRRQRQDARHRPPDRVAPRRARDRKSTRLNSSHSQISYAVFCLKKKKNHPAQGTRSVGRAPPAL